MIKAFLALTAPPLRERRGSKEDVIKQITQLAKSLDVEVARKEGGPLSKYLRGKIPIIYSSNRIFPVAYNWKIKFNETAKIPAFANVFPELNHNEMTGFSSAPNFSSFHFVFLEDQDDDPRILKRMTATAKLLESRGFPISHLPLLTSNIWHKIFQNLLIADWAAFYLAKHYGVDPNEVPMVEEFKNLIKRANIKD